MSSVNAERFYTPSSLDDALCVLAEKGAAASPLAGATWIMRSPLRGERLQPTYVVISTLDELTALHVDDDAAVIGSCVTHAKLSTALAHFPEFRVLAQAAGRSANPSVREMATVGGNLSVTDFPAADLVPALLSLDAEVVLARGKQVDRLPLRQYLDVRADLDPGYLITRVIVPRKSCVSAHARLTLRAAGDYPVAIVSVALNRGATGLIEQIRMAIGSVEPVAYRWVEFESRMSGQPVDAALAAQIAERLCDGHRGRDGVEASGWYRVRVIPSLVRQAFEALAEKR